MRAPTSASRLAILVCLTGVIALTHGCQSPWKLYDAASVTNARKLLVLPAVGAPGMDGPQAGPVQTGLLITVLDRIGRFAVEGPGRSRQRTVAAAGPDQAVWDSSFQADLARQLDADLLVVSEVIDYRATTEHKSSDYFIGQRSWTESTYWAGVSVRLISPADGRLVYFGTGKGKSKLGYGPALLIATQEALIGVTSHLASNPAPQAQVQGAHP